MEMPLKAIIEYGVSIVGLISVAGFLAWLIKTIISENKKREEVYIKFVQEDLKTLNSSMESLGQTLNNFATNTCDAHKYQREEHNKLSENQQKTNEALAGIVEAVGRINGYIK